MIRDHNQLSLDVNVDDSVTTADVSVSLGLIVTELVINALKHAFPEDRNGKIKVDYQSHGPNWTLSVTDNGVGMPTDGARAKPGLGTNIVQALTSQLQAHVKISDANPGTIVSIAHTQIAAVQSAGAMLLSARYRASAPICSSQAHLDSKGTLHAENSNRAQDPTRADIGGKGVERRIEAAAEGSLDLQATPWLPSLGRVSGVRCSLRLHKELVEWTQNF